MRSRSAGTLVLRRARDRPRAAEAHPRRPPALHVRPAHARDAEVLEPALRRFRRREFAREKFEPVGEPRGAAFSAAVVFPAPPGPGPGPGGLLGSTRTRTARTLTSTRLALANRASSFAYSPNARTTDENAGAAANSAESRGSETFFSELFFAASEAFFAASTFPSRRAPSTLGAADSSEDTRPRSSSQMAPPARHPGPECASSATRAASKSSLARAMSAASRASRRADAEGYQNRYAPPPEETPFDGRGDAGRMISESDE